jgi:ribosomal protein L24
MKFNVGDRVKILIGPYKGKEATVMIVDLDGGAKNGWITVKIPGVNFLLYAGEELQSIHP